MPPPLRTAIVYDFDGTLAPGNIQEHALIPEHLGMTKEAFWEIVGREKREHDADEILVYLRLLILQARAAGAPLTRDLLRQYGARTPLYDGVVEWFGRINAHSLERGLALEHYVISSGNEEMIEGTAIGHEFRKVYGSRYRYDANGYAEWPAVAINYTSKTQFLFRVNKGVPNSWEHEPVNRWIPTDERPVPFSRIIYLGDGDTDIPSMKMVRHQGGHSVAVFDSREWENKRNQNKVYNLIAEDRANFVVPADYRDGSLLDITIKGILGRIARDEAGYRPPQPSR